MNRFFLDPALITATQVTFNPKIAHQLRHVLRLGEGDRVEVLDNAGSVYQVRLKFDDHQNGLIGEILEKQPVTAEPKIQLHLIFGLTSREKVEWILQKGTEIGVAVFQPIVSSRTLVQSTDLSDKKFSRWMEIIREAAEQSGRVYLPTLHKPVTLEIVLRESSPADSLSLIAWEGVAGGNRPLKAAFEGQNPTTVRLLVGPEGGFSENEVEVAQSADWHAVSLGPRILRMETAGIVFPALVLQILGEI